MLIRREVPADVDRIDEVHRLAFATTLAGDEPLRSVSCTPCALTRAGCPPSPLWPRTRRARSSATSWGSEGSVDGTPAIGLGPIGVLPDSQRQGIGIGLMHAVIAATDALDYPVVALLGHLDYYPRFGFVPASSLEVLAPDQSWGDHFQARRLAAWTPAVHGTFRYAAPFEAL